MLLLIDHSSLLYRAFHSMPDRVPMHAVHGMLGMLARLIADRRPTRLAVCVDDDWRPAWRVAAIPSYKAHRVAAPGEEDPVPAQEACSRAVLAGLGLAVVGAPDHEAEDVIATLAARTTEPVEILSGDRDLFALVCDPRVQVLYPQRGTSQMVVVDEAEITKRYGIPGRAYLDFALLRGDPSDGLPGVPGVGEKTASRLIAAYGTLDGVLAATAHTPALRARLDAARTYLEAARRVVPPVTTAPVEEIDPRLPGSRHRSAATSALLDRYQLTGAADRLERAVLSVLSTG